MTKSRTKKRITIELPDDVYEDLQVLTRMKSLYEHRDYRVSGLVREFVASGLAQALEAGPVVHPAWRG